MEAGSGFVLAVGPAVVVVASATLAVLTPLKTYPKAEVSVAVPLFPLQVAVVSGEEV